VPTPMAHRHGVVRNGIVQVPSGEGTTLLELGIVVHEPDDPLPGRCPIGPFPQRLLNPGNAPEIGVDVLELTQAHARRMRMGIDEAGQDGHPFGIDHQSAALSDQIRDIARISHREKPAALRGERLRGREVVVLGKDPAVHQNQIRRQVSLESTGRMGPVGDAAGGEPRRQAGPHSQELTTPSFSLGR